MENSNVQGVVHGFKVFRPDWTCSPNGNTKQYACPGKFEEKAELNVCGRGMHFCENAADCFDYYDFDSKNKVAEVIAYGRVLKNGDKSCTDKLEIVREVPWAELLEIVNIGKDCTGFCNTGDCNAGNWNTGNWNAGDCNTGHRNTGHRNAGNQNTGDFNTGDYNTGDYNTRNWNTGNWNAGDYNTGHRNAGSRNAGDYNTGDCNTGTWNAGDWNTGDCNTGNWNAGDYNTGNWNAGDWNTGDWNKSSFNTGCFMTEEQKIMLFNKPSDLTYNDWLRSGAHYLLNQIPRNVVQWIFSSDMTDAEKAEHPTHETTGGYLKVLDESECGQLWWDGLTEADQSIITAIPNFDANIFEQCTGIKVNKEGKH